MERSLKKRIFSAFSTSGRLFIVGILCGFFMSSMLERVTETAKFVERKSEIPYQRVGAMKRTSQVAVVETTHANKGQNEKKYNRILCWVLTSPGNAFKAQKVKDTWGRRCDKLLFMSSANGAVGLPVKESRGSLWKKVTLSVQHLYSNYVNDYEWFYKADDDTYTIMENMRSFVSRFNSSVPYFLGREFKFRGTVYHSGGAGYVLSREALRRVVELGLEKEECGAKSGDVYEDVNMGKCVTRVGGYFADSKDEFGRQRFIPYHVNEFYSGATTNIDFLKKEGADYKLGYECCSDDAITFHYVSGYDMQVYEYLLYRLKIANVTRFE